MGKEEIQRHGIQKRAEEVISVHEENVSCILKLTGRTRKGPCWLVG